MSTWWWLFPRLREFWENVRQFIPCPTLFSFFFFEVEISSRTLIPLFMPGSVHSGSASRDDCGWMFPDKFCASSFPDYLTAYMQSLIQCMFPLIIWLETTLTTYLFRFFPKVGHLQLYTWLHFCSVVKCCSMFANLNIDLYRICIIFRCRAGVQNTGVRICWENRR